MKLSESLRQWGNQRGGAGFVTAWADRAAELEAELAECKMRTLNPDAVRLVDEYTENYKKLEAELERVRSQLPQEMQNCTITFMECSEGHGRLIANNWIDHGCQQCELERARKALTAIRDATSKGEMRRIAVQAL